MGLNFPAAPIVGQVYPTPAQVGVPQWTWNGTAWKAGTIDTANYLLKSGGAMTGHLTPATTGTINLGSASLRWATVYTSDLDLNNGVGDWTIVEGEDDLFIYNNRNDKVYKFALYEVAPATAPPKKGAPRFTSS
jgi:hypothetical protein